MATTLQYLAFLVDDKDGIDASVAMRREAEAIREKLLVADDPLTLEILTDIAHLKSRRTTSSERFTQVAEAAQKIIGVPSPPGAFQVEVEEMLRQVRNLWSAGEHEAARRVIQEKVAPFIERLDKSAKIPNVLHDLGVERMHSDDVDTAEPLDRHLAAALFSLVLCQPCFDGCHWQLAASAVAHHAGGRAASGTLFSIYSSLHA